MSLFNGQLEGQLIAQGSFKNFSVAIFWDKCDECQALLGGIILWALLVHATFSDQGHNSRSWQCHFFLMEILCSYAIKLKFCRTVISVNDVN